MFNHSLHNTASINVHSHVFDLAPERVQDKLHFMVWHFLNTLLDNVVTLRIISCFFLYHNEGENQICFNADAVTDSILTALL